MGRDGRKKNRVKKKFMVLKGYTQYLYCDGFDVEVIHKKLSNCTL